MKWITLPHEYNAGKPSIPPEATELDPVMDCEFGVSQTCIMYIRAQRVGVA